jgi:hypothetical protein
MTLPPSDIKAQVFKAITAMAETAGAEVGDESRLIGNGSLMNSMKLVELCLQLEDLAADLGFEFDWTSGAAMSRSRSMFRTAGALAEEFRRQLEAAP